MAVLVCATLAYAQPVAAQQSVDYASVSGRVTDQQGAPVPGAQVSARRTDTNLTTETVTDTSGRFRFAYLKAGHYELKGRLQGFADLTRSLTLAGGSAFDLSLVLSIAGLETNVSV